MPPVPRGRTAVPPLPVPFVPRARLLTALDDGARGVALVSAPAGFGKTALLAHWARTNGPDIPIAWADLAGVADENIWPVILAALRACPAVPSDSALHELGRSGSLPPIPVLMAEVAGALDTLPVKVTLVLHDVHEITAPAALAGLETLLAAPPAWVRLILCSRWDTPLSLGALRSTGALSEIRADTLRFSAHETDEMLRRSNLHLDESKSRELHACTGGWPAGVRLATAALHRGADPSTFLGRCSDAPEPVADFLVEEVLAVLPVADRDLLAVSSLGGPITADLAATLSGRSDAGEVLDRLSRDTGLVQRGSAGGFRVHPLVPPHLRAALARGEGRAADLHRRSARWWAAHDDPLAAIHHAVRADDTDLLVELVHRFAGLLLVTGHHSVLGQVLIRLGESVVAGDPWLTLTDTLTRIEAGRETVPIDLPSAPIAPPADGSELSRAAARLTVLRSITSLFAALSSADLGATPGPVDEQRSRRDNPEWAGLALVGAGGRALLVDADRAAAIAFFAEALELARAHGFGYLEMQCLGLLGSVQGIGGDYPAMTAAAAGADAAAVARGWEASPVASAARWMLAYGALMRAEPTEAHRLAAAVLRRGEALLRPRYVFALRAVQGAALFDSGQRHRGLQEMQQARADLGAVPLSAEQAAALAVLEHHAAVRLGRPEAARVVVAWLVERIGLRGEILLMRAWAELAAGRDHTARAVVEPVLDGSVTSVLPHTVVEALLVEATARVTGGDVRTARRALRDALASGASLGAVRPFAMAGGQARELLIRHVGRAAETGPFAARALAASRRPDTRTARLDDGELRLLARLPSPLSVDQIARELRIPPTEVSSRIRALYLKLGVSSRRTAVSVAYERGLLR